MPHSYLAIRHLIRELELKGRPRSRHVPPAWLKSFLEDAAECFEPRTGEARVGYVCRCTESGWDADMFLGGTEIIGGRDDGHVGAVDFQFDLPSLLSRLETVESAEWSTDSGDARETQSAPQSLKVVGTLCGEQVRLRICSRPPASCAPAMRQYADGRCELC